MRDERQPERRHPHSHQLSIKEHVMNKTAIFASLCAFAALQAAPVIAAESGGNKAQTTRMSECSSQAKEKGLKGDARKEHMSQCLRNPVSQAAAKECGATAAQKGLKGERRKEFVTDCVKGKTPAGNVG